MARGPLAVAVLTAMLPAAATADAPPSAGGTLTVLAAASLTDAFRAVGADFERAHPGLRVVFDFAGTPTLARQIEEGAPADVFASADEANMQRLAQAGLLAAAPTVFARNHLTVVVGAGNPKRVGGLADLAREGLVVALCAPNVPAGHYAAEAFVRAGIRVPAASQEADVRAVVMKVALGEADAGIVYATDVRAGGARVQAVDIPAAHGVVARYPIAALKGARDRRAADDFVAFVVSAAGQEVLARFGFLGR